MIADIKAAPINETAVDSALVTHCLMGCQYYYADPTLDCQNPNGKENAQLSNLQVYGKDAGSKCFTGNLTLSYNSPPTSFCFTYNCQGSGADAILNIKVDKFNVECTEAGSIQITGYNGALDCPDPDYFAQRLE